MLVSAGEVYERKSTLRSDEQAVLVIFASDTDGEAGRRRGGEGSGDGVPVWGGGEKRLVWWC